MNLLLLNPEALHGALQTIRGARAEHVRKVLKCSIGAELRAGIIGYGTGVARVHSLAPGMLQVSYEHQLDVPVREANVLVLALPRPPVFSRCLEHAVALGFSDILLFRSHRVERSALSSHVFEKAAMTEHIHNGLEQARLVHPPTLQIANSMKELISLFDAIEQRTSTIENRFLMHPHGAPAHALKVNRGRYAMVIGPEGGFIEEEVRSFEAQSFHSYSYGPHPLRVEAALSYGAGQLDLLSRAEERQG